MFLPYLQCYVFTSIKFQTSQIKTQLLFPLCWPRPNIHVEAPQAQVSRAKQFYTICWPRLHMIDEAPQAQVSRVIIYLQSVGQELSVLKSPKDTGKQSTHFFKICLLKLNIIDEAIQAQVG